MFVAIAIPNVEAVEKEKNGDDNQVCPLYCIETISEGECEPASKCPYFGVLTILGGTETTIYSEKGGEILGHHEGKQIVLVTLTQDIMSTLKTHGYLPERFLVLLFI